MRLADIMTSWSERSNLSCKCDAMNASPSRWISGMYIALHFTCAGRGCQALPRFANRCAPVVTRGCHPTASPGNVITPHFTGPDKT